ncbi:hypothetical protein C0J52_11091 [Blattella germanica]|nr:hypothetical protein C0J52_11091 [Blattella germanica]
MSYEVPVWDVLLKLVARKLAIVNSEALLATMSHTYIHHFALPKSLSFAIIQSYSCYYTYGSVLSSLQDKTYLCYIKYLYKCLPLYKTAHFCE